jgi:DNA polymerase-1
MTSLVYGIDYNLLDAVVVKKDKKHPQYNDLSAKRSGVKTVTFGVPYGAGPKRIAEMIQEKDKNGCVIETMDHAVGRAKELIDNYFGAAPMLKAWLQEMKYQAQTKGYTCSIEGRRRWYDLPNKDNPDYEKIMSQIGRYAGNHPIQSSSADMLKEALRRLYLLNRGWDGGAAEPWTGRKVVDANVLLVAHDEIVTDAALKDAERQKAMLVQAMSDAYNAVSMEKQINGVMQRIYLKNIYNSVDAIQADYWAKD